MALSTCLVLMVPTASSSTSHANQLLGQLFKDAKAHEASEEWSRAEYCYRKLAFATGQKKFHRKYRKLLSRRVDRLLEDAEAAAVDDPWAQFELLDRAYRADPDRTEARDRLQELGYFWTRAGWERLVEDDTNELSQDEADAQLEKHRRDRLKVRPNFGKIQRGVVSIYTDVDTRQARSTLKQMMNANLSGFRAFGDVMRPLVRRPVEEVVIVYFQKKEDYHRISLAPPGSAGVYYPDRRGGYFYSINFSTMLHEMAHQYTDLMLSGMNCHPWFVEGIAEYFGAASMSQGGKRMKVGIPDASRLADYKELAAQGQIIPLRDFQSMSTNLQNDLYAQAWALTHYLMETDPAGRLYLFDYIAHANGLAYELGLARDMSPLTLSQVMRRNGSSLSDLEAAMFQHYGVRRVDR